MAFHKSKKSALILIVFTLPFLDIIVDIHFGIDELHYNPDLKINNTQIGHEDIPVSRFKYIFETTHFERAHVHPIQLDRAPPQA